LLPEEHFVALSTVAELSSVLDIRLRNQVREVSYRVIVFYATFNNISGLLVEESGVLGENHRPATSHRQTLSHNVILSTPRLNGIRTHNVSCDRH